MTCVLDCAALHYFYIDISKGEKPEQKPKVSGAGLMACEICNQFRKASQLEISLQKEPSQNNRQSL